ncbi:MAG: cyclopropane-fatty-acyl-phospholipid synthase family protein [Coriobacteriia bacterium]|nr:cyclopropane-fatty-acyl-phospholipid synthase family protein [Coriobacteriia bacterium]
MTDTTGSARTADLPLGLRVLRPALEGIEAGTLCVRWADERRWSFGGVRPGPKATIVVPRPAAALRRMLYNGATGFAEGYVAGDWDSPDLGALLRMATLNMPADTMLSGVLFPGELVDRAAHLLRPNSPAGSRRNIHAHYDLGNEFYSLWLDPSMTYSCAMFDAECGSLDEAQTRKWDRLLDLLDPREGDDLLEIGCGWGGFAIHAARTRGLRVTGVTISDEQHAWALARVAEAGLSDRVEIRLQDYREITGTFDHVASIEMFEAVGERYWPTFFRTVRDRLRPGGVAALQTITIDHARFLDYRVRADFIQRYVFPGGMVPSPKAFEQAAADAGLRMQVPHFFGCDYAATLAEWERRFTSSIAEVRALGFDERFERVWRYYLAYCRAGFSSGMIDVMQVALR